MIISWKWLQEYVPLAVSVHEAAERFRLTGLNHESTTAVGDDYAVDLEVTSNRPDCLGHLGIAREAAVLYGAPLSIPAGKIETSNDPITQYLTIENKAPELCPRYMARVVRGVRIGPSPKWLAERLATIGIASVNNVVDVTNYVLMESGQPLHAFDLGQLKDRRIIIRAAAAKEPFNAINHKLYSLEPGMCVIADAQNPVALGGIMGGASSEIGPETRDVVVETAEFVAMNIRNTSRKLNLRSDSSYRFERPLDRSNMDWVSRRCCELIVQVAGGSICQGVIDLGARPVEPAAVRLRYERIERVLGIRVPEEEIVRILTALGCRLVATLPMECTIAPPTWRKDLTREIDLVEEVARVYGYDKIPEDVRVAMARGSKTPRERMLEKVRRVMTASGFDEAMTISAVPPEWSEAFSPWTRESPLVSSTPVLRTANHLRRSLLPSLAGARRLNESLANEVFDLFETAKVYLPVADSSLPQEELVLAAASGFGLANVKPGRALDEDALRRSCTHLKGVLQAVLDTLAEPPKMSTAPLEPRDDERAFFLPGGACRVLLNGRLWGFLGVLSDKAKQAFELRGESAMFEVLLSPLQELAVKPPQYKPISTFPSVRRDVNLVVAELTTWAQIERVVEQSAGALLESLQLVDVYRNAEKLGAGRKSLVFSADFRSSDSTLTSVEVDALRDRIVDACKHELGAEQR